MSIEPTTPLPWLARTISGRWAVALSVAAALVYVVYGLSVVFLMRKYMTYPPVPKVQTDTYGMSNQPLKLLLYTASSAIFNTFVFGYVLVGILFWRFGKGQLDRLWLFIVISAVLMGLANGGPILVFLQGVLGVLCSVVFIKCGGFYRITGLRGLTYSALSSLLVGLTAFVFVLLGYR